MALLDRVSDDVLVGLREKGLTLNEIGELFGVSPSTISKELKKRHIDINYINKSLRHLRNEELIEFRQSNMSYKQIGEMFELSENTIKNEYTRRGIDIELKRVTLLCDIDNETLIKWRRERKSYDIIAQELCISKSAVFKEYQKRGITDNCINRSRKIDTSKIQAMRGMGITIEKIAEILDVSVTTVNKEITTSKNQ